MKKAAKKVAKKAFLIKHWKDAWRFFSVQAGIIGSSISLAYLAMYDQLKDTVPPKYMFGLTAAVFALGVVGRVVKQK